MHLFDSHCHLDSAIFGNDAAAALQRAAQAGVVGMMAIGIDLESSRQAASLAATHPRVYAAAGVHPHDASHCTAQTLDMLTELAQQPGVRAWGEIGLDFNRMYSPAPVQEKWFIRQIERAGQMNLPLVFHERDSQGRFLQLLQQTCKSPCRGVVHCFSGNARERDAYLELGLHIGITGIITLKQRGADLRRLVGAIPDERLLVETDAPFLTPTPDRNKYRRNEPAFVKTVLLKLAAVRDQDPAQLAAITTANARRLFGIVCKSEK